MRNLSYREAAVSLALIAGSAMSAYQLWFAPALAQLERDRRTLEQLVAVLAAPPDPGPQAPVVGGVLACPPQAPLSPAPTSAAPPAQPRRQRTRTRAADRSRTSQHCDAKDPLCDDVPL
jgi:hypothetical protein